MQHRERINLYLKFAQYMERSSSADISPKPFHLTAFKLSPGKMTPDRIKRVVNEGGGGGGGGIVIQKK